MDMLRFLTQKLRAQSLNEVQPYETKSETDEDSDYNTDSEEENQEIEELLEDRRMCNGLSSSSLNHAHPVIVTPHPVRLRPLEEIINSTENILSSCDRDRHSSEEELSTLEKQPTPEKRKWSQMSRGGPLGIAADLSGSSDEEVKELCAAKPVPLQFSATPPRYLHRLSRKHPDGNSPSVLVTNVCPAEIASPRKRHKNAYHHLDSRHAQNGRCLDFEKMQQKQYFKKYPIHGHSLSHSHGVRGARVVRIKGMNLNNRIPPRLLRDPATFSFRSLSTVNPLTPVEDASTLAAY